MATSIQKGLQTNRAPQGTALMLVSATSGTLLEDRCRTEYKAQSCATAVCVRSPQLRLDSVVSQLFRQWDLAYGQVQVVRLISSVGTTVPPKNHPTAAQNCLLTAVHGEDVQHLPQ